MADRDILRGLPTYEQLLRSQQTTDPTATALQSGLTGLLTGRQIRTQAEQAQQAKLAQAEKILLERSQASKAEAQAKATGAREERLTAAGELSAKATAEKTKSEGEYRNALLDLKRQELEYKKHLLDAHSSGNNKDILKLQSTFDKTYNQPLSDAQAALDEFKSRYEDAIKEGSVGLAAGAKAGLESAVTGGTLKPKFSVFRKSTATLVPSLQKGLGINRTSTAEIKALTKGVPSGFEDPNVGRQYIKTVQDVIDRKKKENANLIKNQVELLKTGKLTDLTETLHPDRTPGELVAPELERPPLESLIEE